MSIHGLWWFLLLFGGWQWQTLPGQDKPRGQSHMFRMVLQALDEIRDGFAFIANLVDSSEEWEPVEKVTIRQ